MRGSCDEDATGGDGCGMVLGKGEISHGRGIRSSEEGAVHLVVDDDALSIGIDIGNGGGSGTLTELGVSSIRTGSSYCSIDKYSC